MKKKLHMIILLGFLTIQYGFAMDPGQITSLGKETAPSDTSGMIKPKKKGRFFISPFYQFAHLTNLKLISSVDNFKMVDGNGSYEFSQEQVDQYNQYYKTLYTNSMVGIRVGYQLMEGLGIQVFGGVSHFDFKSWVSDDNTSTMSTDYPSVLLGAAIDYKFRITDHLAALAILSYNYSKTGSTENQNNSGEKVISSKLTSMFWEANLALGYRLGHFLPYAGAGYLQQFVHPTWTEQVPYTDENGILSYDEHEFDTHYRGHAFYGFVGTEFLLFQNLSVYARCSFMNPLTATLGFRIQL